MRYRGVVILAVAVLLLSSVTYGLVSADDSTNSYDTSSNTIANFTVHINNQQIIVFKNFTVSGHTTHLNMPSVDDKAMNPLYWQGVGNITIVPAISYSEAGNFSYSNQNFQYVYFYTSNYFGILLTTGFISESGSEIFIKGPSSLSPYVLSYVNSPLSQYNFNQNSFQKDGNFYYGNYSSFSYLPGQLENYSLINNQSTVRAISSIFWNGSATPSFNISTLVIPNETTFFASDGLFPIIYIDSFSSPVTVRLADGFHFMTREGKDGNEGNDMFAWSLPYQSENVFKIESGSRTVGYVDVFGTASVNNATLEVNSPVSFLLIRFLPSSQTVNGFDNSNDQVKNATTEILVENQAFFVPFSPNITSLNLTFEKNTLFFQFVQNGTQQVVIVIHGNFSVSKFLLTGGGNNSSNYVITRSGNETIITFSTNGSGQRNLSLSISPYGVGFGEVQRLSLIALIASTSALVVVTLSLILYSRKKFEKEFEKE